MAKKSDLLSTYKGQILENEISKIFEEIDDLDSVNPNDEPNLFLNIMYLLNMRQKLSNNAKA